MISPTLRLGLAYLAVAAALLALALIFALALARRG
jgi:hypothetical protein